MYLRERNRVCTIVHNNVLDSSFSEISAFLSVGFIFELDF